MPYLTAGDVVLVTGATGAIGFEIAAQAAADGAIVGVHGSSDASVANAIERLRERVPRGTFIPTPGDFRDGAQIESVVAKIVREGGRLDAVIHCAITGVPGTSGVFLKTDPANYGLFVQYTLGVFQQLCRAAVPHMAERGGTIIGFASDSGRFAAPRQSMVGAVFGGIMSFVRNLATEVARDGVRIHCISPTYVENTPIFDTFSKITGRAEAARARAGLGLPSPADIAPVTLFLCGPGASKITGQIISVNGGLNA